MFKAALFATTLALAASPAAAGSWGFGVGVRYGPPIYWGPPPVYYDYGAPIIVEPPPPYYYEQPPVVVLPPEAPPAYGMVEPDVVLDRARDGRLQRPAADAAARLDLPAERHRSGRQPGAARHLGPYRRHRARAHPGARRRAAATRAVRRLLRRACATGCRPRRPARATRSSCIRSRQSRPGGADSPLPVGPEPGSDLKAFGVALRRIEAVFAAFPAENIPIRRLHLRERQMNGRFRFGSAAIGQSASIVIGRETR